MFHHNNIQCLDIPGKTVYIHTVKRKDIKKVQVSYQIEWDLDFDKSTMR